MDTIKGKVRAHPGQWLEGFQQIIVGGEDGRERSVPLALAFNKKGEPIPVRPHLQPDECDHEGEVYSCELAMHCSKCGAPLFLPPRYLAGLHIAVIEYMEMVWRAAGWPWFRGGRWTTVGGVQDDGTPTWTVKQHPLFEVIGGIPVRHDKLAEWEAIWG